MYKAFSMHGAYSPGESLATQDVGPDLSPWKVIYQGFEPHDKCLMREAQEPEFTKRKEVPITALNAHPQASDLTSAISSVTHFIQHNQTVPWAPATSSERRCSRRFHGSRALKNIICLGCKEQWLVLGTRSPGSNPTSTNWAAGVT